MKCSICGVARDVGCADPARCDRLAASGEITVTYTTPERAARQEQTRDDVISLLAIVASRTNTIAAREKAVAALERIQAVLKDAGALPT